MPERSAPISLAGIGLDELQALLDARQLPPVDRWNPAHCGHSGIRIGRDGRWFHEGSPIARSELVRLFASILRREPDGQHMLVTPVEKLTIDVESTAFRATEMVVEGRGESQRLAFALDHSDPIILGPSHPLLMVRTGGGVSPRLQVRFGLEAELSRPVYYELAELALAEGLSGVWSDGAFFRLEEEA